MRCELCTLLPPTLDSLIGWRHFHGSAPCWWLVRETYRDHLGIRLSQSNVLKPRRQWRQLIQRGLIEWHRIALGSEEPYDGVLLRTEHVDHMGLVIAPGRFLHVPRPEAGVVVTPFTAYTDRGHRLWLYRHRSRWSPTPTAATSSTSTR
ncbi:MAG: hypothetical protein ACT4P5_02265 [Armatimonadota bacterium]